MDQHRKRIEVTERRAAEAQRGRERLERAREDVSVDLTIVRQSRELPPALDAFIVRFAAHHLTQLILREGKESASYAASIRALQELMAIYDQAELGVPLDRLPGIDRPAIESILASSGVAHDAADQVFATLQRTLGQLSSGDEAAASAEELPASPLPVTPEPAASDTPELELVAGKATLDFDPAMAERMRALEVGTWLQLTSDSGRVEPAKVSWVSPISGRLLFVNRRGIRVLVASIEELAAMARLGKVQLREADTAFDDAMQQVMGRLQSSTPPGVASA
jgi:hypothetical protein